MTLQGIILKEVDIMVIGYAIPTERSYRTHHANKKAIAHPHKLQKNDLHPIICESFHLKQY
ncbi:hypothetical protein VB713_28110 [Anabaena cylindrica UHCC 0172]|uniref:hypothetical protein n=1 Tax=Anabaena cylindrica TaxID=1165 RepID=UPI002B218678|nr:hypothetical protein [Anabaena cylindrica]MEA5554793.1 hypothetical protein [Anabaena cylindrica UHCC 0172]